MSIFFALFLCGLTSLAQLNGWSDPMAITDSLHNNRNVTFPPGWTLNSDSLYVAWEVADDTLSTEIWCRNINGSGTPFQLLGSPGIQYRNSRIFQNPSGDTLFYLYYETNEAGNWDIMYIGYLGNGAVSVPVPVRASPADETDFSCMDFYGAVWQEGEAILFRQYTIPGGFVPGTQDQVIAQENCRNPVFSGYYIAFEKPVGGDIGLWTSAFNYAQHSYDPPETVIDTGSNQNKNLGMGFSGQELVWQAKSAGLWRLFCTYLPQMMPESVIDFEGANNIQPVYSYMVVGVRTDYPFYPSMLTFASDISGNFEIYAYDEFWSTDYVNLSEYAQDDLHPQLFVVWNYEPEHGNLILTWESNRNGHWQIWMCNMDIYLAVPEDQAQADDGKVVAVPNPFSVSTTLTLTMSSPAAYQVIISSSVGRIVRSFSGTAAPAGPLEIVWDGRDQQGTPCPAGMYLVSLHSGDRMTHGRVIVAR